MIVDDRRRRRWPCTKRLWTDRRTTNSCGTLHKTIKAVTRDTERLDFNTAIARMMEFVNFFTRQTQRPRSAMEAFVLLLSPYAPHISEELWSVLGHDASLAYATLARLRRSTDAGRLDRDAGTGQWQAPAGKVSVPPDCPADEMIAAAKADAKIALWLENVAIVKEVAVPGRLVNFVVKRSCRGRRLETGER